MKINRVGFVGWRGMVGSVLLERMRAENDFDNISEAVFFTTSQTGQPAPDVGIDCPPLQDAYDIEQFGRSRIPLGGLVRQFHSANLLYLWDQERRRQRRHRRAAVAA